MPLKLLALLIVLACGTVDIAAHHPFSATYRENEEVTIEGVLVRIVYRNPHSYLHVMTEDGSRQTRVWAVECSSGDRLRRSNLTEDTLKPGDRVVIKGSPGLDSAVGRVRLRSIVRPRDGWRWSDAAK